MAESLGQHTATAEDNSAQNANAQGSAQQAPKTLMFQINPLNQDWEITEYWNNYFHNEHMIVQTLRGMENPKWSEEQVTVYHMFLSTVEGLILAVYAKNYYYFEEYQAWFEYTVQNNPVGFELYKNQLKYLEYLQKEQLKEDRRNNRDVVQKPEQPKPRTREPEKEEKVVVRSNDPEINIQKLFTTEWPDKYLSTDFLAKENANIVFIGHVDSGKSTLTGNILKSLGQVDQQEILKAKQDAKMNKMEAWEDAGISNCIPEERIDGKTREYAKMNFSLTKKRFTLFDAPGHKNYVPNMIMGACQADIAILIISAKEGQFESGFEKDGQSKEHAMLAKALGVFELIVVVTKMGTVEWSEKRFNHIRDQVTPFLESSCGFSNVTFIPVDSIENKNIHSKAEEAWIKGTYFTDYLDNVKLPERKPMGPLRIPVIDKFKDQGQLYVYGKVESGTIIEDQTVTVLPQRLQMVVKEIFNAKDEKMGFACAGQNVKMRVKNVEEDDITRGDMVCNNLNYCQESAELKANITILELPEEKKLLSSGYECVLHMHAIAAQIEISHVQSKVDRETKKVVKCTFLKPGDKGVCQIKIERPICLEKYEFMPSLGRFTLRDQGKTIGFGEIIGIKPAKKLFDEQKEHLGGKKEEGKTVQDRKTEEVAKQVEKLTVNDSKE